MEKRSLNSVRKPPFLLLLAVLISVVLTSGPGLAASGSIGVFAEFSGEVMVRSQGAWGGEPVAGLPIFSGDKIVTADGRADLIFEDGARVVLCQYSVLELKQWTQRGLPVIKKDLTRRRLILYMGKMWVDTDYRKMRTEVATPQATFGLRGDKGGDRISVLVSIGRDGETRMKFDEGDHSFVIGPWDPGVQDNVPPGFAKARQFIQLSTSAYLRARIAQETDSKTWDNLDQGLPEKLRKLAWTRAYKAAALDERYCSAYFVQWNPERQVLADAETSFRSAEKRLETLEEEEKALEPEALEEHYAALEKAQMESHENQLALSSLDVEEIGEPVALKGPEQPMEGMESLGIPQAGAFSGMDPCK